MPFTDDISYNNATSSPTDDNNADDDLTISGAQAQEQGYPEQDIEDLEDESIKPDDELEETITDDQNADDSETNPDDQDIRSPKSEQTSMVGDEDSEEIDDNEAWEEREEEIDAADEE